MSNSLRDKVVVVTGASSGIGRSIVLESASRGATVILMARHQDKLEEIANEARQLSGNDVFVFPTDIVKLIKLIVPLMKLLVMLTILII